MRGRSSVGETVARRREWTSKLDSTFQFPKSYSTMDLSYATEQEKGNRLRLFDLLGLK